MFFFRSFLGIYFNDHLVVALNNLQRCEYFSEFYRKLCELNLHQKNEIKSKL